MAHGMMRHCRSFRGGMVKLKVVLTGVAVGAALSALQPPEPLEFPPVAALWAPVSRADPAHPMPRFVLPLVSIHPSGVDYGVASAFVVDRERGYLATAAHVGIGTKFLVLLPEGIWLPATRIRSSDVADVSLLAIPEGMGPLLPEAPMSVPMPPSPYLFAQADGWRLQQYRGVLNIDFRPDVRLMNMLRGRVTVCAASMDSCRELMGMVERAAKEGRGLRGSERYLAYDRFVLLLDMDESDRAIRYGMSGGAVLDFAGRPFAVISMSNGMTMLAVPLDEVFALIR